MNRLVVLGCAASAATLIAACGETTRPSLSSDFAIDAASVYSATPAGFSELSSSYSTTGAEGAFQPMFNGHGGPGRGGPGDGPGFGLGFMGGGLGGPFLGDGFGPGNVSASSKNCVFAAATGLTCTDTTHDGLLVKRVVKYTTASGTVQQALDSTTNTVATTSTVSGTATHRDSSTSVENHTSTQTVTGLAKGSASRTINGASYGTEASTGKSTAGTFTSNRVTADTTKALVVPASTTANRSPYPTAGSVTRVMNATVTVTGSATTTRKEVVTYDGSATAKVVITKDGVVQNCTVALPHGKLACT